MSAPQSVIDALNALSRSDDQKYDDNIDDLTSFWDESSVSAMNILAYSGFDAKAMRNKIYKSITNKFKDQSTVNTLLLVLVASCMRNRRFDSPKGGFSEEQKNAIKALYTELGLDFAAGKKKATPQQTVMQQVVASFPDLVCILASRMGTSRAGGTNVFMNTPGFWAPSFISALDIEMLKKDASAYEKFYKAYEEYGQQFNDMINAKNNLKGKDEWKAYIPTFIQSNAMTQTARNAFTKSFVDKNPAVKELFAKFGYVKFD